MNSLNNDLMLLLNSTQHGAKKVLHRIEHEIRYLKKTHKSTIPIHKSISEFLRKFSANNNANNENDVKLPSFIKDSLLYLLDLCEK